MELEIKIFIKEIILPASRYFGDHIAPQYTVGGRDAVVIILVYPYRITGLEGRTIVVLSHATYLRDVAIRKINTFIFYYPERIYSLADFQFTILDTNFVPSPRQSCQLFGVKAKGHTGIPPKITWLTVYNISANGNIQPYTSDIHTGFDFIFVPMLRL